MTNTADVNWASKSGPVTGRRVYNEQLVGQEGARRRPEEHHVTAVVNVTPVQLNKPSASGDDDRHQWQHQTPYTIEATTPATPRRTVSPSPIPCRPDSPCFLAGLQNAALGAAPAIVSSGHRYLVVSIPVLPASRFDRVTLGDDDPALPGPRHLDYAGGPVASGPISNGAQLGCRAPSHRAAKLSLSTRRLSRSPSYSPH